MTTKPPAGTMSALAIELARADTLKIDRVLAPVRECLEGLQTFWIDQGGDTPVEWHWCDPNADCSDACLAARQLYERLKIQ